MITNKILHSIKEITSINRIIFFRHSKINSMINLFTDFLDKFVDSWTIKYDAISKHWHGNIDRAVPFLNIHSVSLTSTQHYPLTAGRCAGSGPHLVPGAPEAGADAGGAERAGGALPRQ